MLIEMAFHLPLRFNYEAQADAIAHERGERADCERPGIPERIEEARARVELLQASLTPGEVIGFLAGCFHEQVASCRGAGHESLAVVEGLRGYLTCVVYPHEGSCSAPFCLG